MSSAKCDMFILDAITTALTLTDTAIANHIVRTDIGLTATAHIDPTATTRMDTRTTDIAKDMVTPVGIAVIRAMLAPM